MLLLFKSIAPKVYHYRFIEEFVVNAGRNYLEGRNSALVGLMFDNDDSIEDM